MSNSQTAPSDRAVGYRPQHTLPLRVEALRQLRRRRTMVIAAVLFALPFIVLAAFQIGGTPTRPDQTTFVTLATASGPNFAATLLFMGTGFILVIPVALFCGDTVAAEAGWSSLRYLLAAPVPRGGCWPASSPSGCSSRPPRSCCCRWSASGWAPPPTAGAT